jgi:hypothetical protein
VVLKAQGRSDSQGRPAVCRGRQTRWPISPLSTLTMCRWNKPAAWAGVHAKIQSLTDHAVPIRLGPEIRPERMKNYLLRLAGELNVPVTARKVPDGVIFWRSSDEDRHQAQEVAQRLQGTGHKHSQARGGRRRRT